MRIKTPTAAIPPRKEMARTIMQPPPVIGKSQATKKVTAAASTPAAKSSQKVQLLLVDLLDTGVSYVSEDYSVITK